MIKFFRKIRQKLLSENKFSKYLIYAFGEITLVVIGILIALQINNWNETQKEKTKLNNILNIVKSDLIKDTLKISFPIKYYEKKNALLSKIIEREDSKSELNAVNELNFKSYSSNLNILTNHEEFYMQSKGIKLLQNLSMNSSFEKDTLINNLIEHHSVYENFFKYDNEEMGNLTKKNIEEDSKYSWFIDRINKNYNRNMFVYHYGDTFKRKSARFRIFSKQFLGDLRNYDSIAKSYIYRIEKRLEKNNKNTI